jgi:hypothetical protein
MINSSILWCCCVKLRFVIILKVLSNNIEKLRRHFSLKISWEDISFQHDYLK